MLGIDKFLSLCDVKQGRALVCGSKIHEGTNKPDRRKLYADAIGVDMLDGEGVDLIHDLEQPLDMAFEHVDCVSTLEHVQRPWLFAKVIDGCLMDGGTILIALPWVWPVHDYPYDLWRMTPQAIEFLFPSVRWEKQKYIVEEKLVKRVPRLSALGTRYLARSELAMFGRKCS